MPIGQPSLGSVNTGVATTLKMSSEDAAVNAEAVVKKATQEAAVKKATEDQIKYVTVGNPVFNCYTESHKQIQFVGGAFFADKSDVETINALQHHITVGTIEIAKD